MPVLVVTCEGEQDCTLSFVDIGELETRDVIALLGKINPKARTSLAGGVGLAAEPGDIGEIFPAPATEEALEPYMTAPKELRQALAQCWKNQACFKPFSAKLVAGKVDRFSLVDDL